MIKKEESKKTKSLGWFFIVGIWVVSGVLILVVGSLLLLFINGKYLSSSLITEEVTVIKIRGFSYQLNSDIPGSTMCLVNFQSGEKKEVNFLGEHDFKPGIKLNLKYKKTKLFKSIVVDNFEILDKT